MGRGHCKGQREDMQVDKKGPLPAQKTPQAQGSPEGVARLHGSRREKGVQETWGFCGWGPPGTHVLPRAALLAELSRIFILVSARFTSTLGVPRPGAWSYFFFI